MNTRTLGKKIFQWDVYIPSSSCWMFYTTFSSRQSCTIVGERILRSKRNILNKKSSHEHKWNPKPRSKVIQQICSIQHSLFRCTLEWHKGLLSNVSHYYTRRTIFRSSSYKVQSWTLRLTSLPCTSCPIKIASSSDISFFWRICAQNNNIKQN